MNETAAAAQVVNDLQSLREACREAEPDNRQQGLLDSLRAVAPALQFQLILSRGGWHRLGGVVDADGRRIAQHLDLWLEEEAGDDVDILLSKYLDCGYQITRLHGLTHYLVAPLSDRPDDFLQLEVEELQAVFERPLFDLDNPPENVADILEPDGYQALEPVPLGKPFYDCRRLTHIADFIKRMAGESESELPLQRLFRDWKNSSAVEEGHFCQHWRMSLREYIDPYGEPVLLAKPKPVFAGELPEMEPGATTRGAALANYIHDFDRRVGYPMAWYFYMLCRKKVSTRITQAIYNDLQGAYAYLPARDLKILNAWIDAPYTV